MRTPPGRQAGYTILELAFVVAATVTGLALLGSLVGSTENLTAETHGHTRAASEHRANLRAITNLLRGADVTTLRGIVPDGPTSSLEFQCVAGVDKDGRSYEPVQRIQWESTPLPVWDEDHPGRLVVVDPEGKETVVAKNVPLGGFEVRQEGSTLAIRLTTYYTLGPKKTFRVSSETAVALRN